MAGRLALQHAAPLLAALVLTLAAAPSGTLVRYRFDDDRVAPGPDTYSGYRSGAPPHTSLMLKLSDIHHLLGDLQKEREYREAIYGSLHEEQEHPPESPRPPPPGDPGAQEEPDADLD